MSGGIWVKLYRDELYRVNFVGVTTTSCRGDMIFGIIFGIGIQFGVVIDAKSCLGWKPHKLEGCRGLNNFFTRLWVTTEFCRGDKMTPMSSGCTPTGRGATLNNPEQPRSTPIGAVMKGVVRVFRHIRDDFRVIERVN